MQLLIPMVGLGQRFRDAGFDLPKPLIEVDGVPMVVRVVRDLPICKTLVFVVNSNHVAEYQIDRRLKEHFPEARIVVSDGLTEGQACSTQLGCSELSPDEDVLVAACDNTHLYDAQRLSQLAATSDALIWTYRNEPRVLENPNWYGWVDCDQSNNVRSVSVKKPISDTPLHDHVVSGAFWFRTAKLLDESISQLVANNVRVNNEFYLDSVPDLLTSAGSRVKAFEVDKYIGWGTPNDYYDYLKWSHYVRRCSMAA